MSAGEAPPDGGDALSSSPPRPPPIPPSSEDPPAPQDAENSTEAVRVPRSASYTYLPSLTRSSTAKSRSKSKSRTHSPVNFSRAFTRRKSEDPRQIRIASFNADAEDDVPDTSYKSQTSSRLRRSFGPISWTVTDSLASFARKSWVSSSRSPSPSGRMESRPSSSDGERIGRSEEPSTATGALSASLGAGAATPPEESGNVTSATRSIRSKSKRRSALLRRPSKRSPSPLLSAPRPSERSAHQRSPSLPRSVSFDRLPSLSRLFANERPAPMPTSASTDRLQSPGLEPTFRRKDELWSAFRALDHDFQKFQTKSSALKANVVRTSLLPFLSAYVDHPSNKILRPGDLDRRVLILNKWWTGLLDMLEGGHQSLSGTDRPILLDGIVGIMTRPEWRAPPSAFAPMQKSASQPSLATSKRTRSSTSLASSASDFIAESIHHNIRNMFIQNLMAQAAIVVDKLSLKTAPASLVVFGGKAMAYAFYFCPGLAEVLVRLWATPSESIRRVLKEFDVVESAEASILSDGLALCYPECLRGLTFKSFASTVKGLRKPPTLPLSARKINWRGPWTGRWAGRDSDLFFGFVKQWHILADDFLPPDVGLRERACAPAFVLVHAQLLTVLDATIRRRPNAPLDAMTSSITFDDVLTDADASAAALPLAATNLTRSMAENRLIMLLRDVLGGRSPVADVVRHHVAQVFVRLLQAAARKVSLFNQNACFTLCDFLEESATIMVRYQKGSPPAADLIDWRFWLAVCQQMAASQNTMSELRLFAFLYGVWGLVTADETRKEVLCLEWLLTEKTFGTFFSHWCPIIRAYYMRLLCWRVARCDDEPSDVDLKILRAIADRLTGAWSHFLRARAQAEADGTRMPSTAACSPAPGRRLLIVRSDTQVDPNFLLSLNAPTSAPRPSTREKRWSAADSLVETGSRQANARASLLHDENQGPRTEPGARKKWGLLRNIRSFSSPASGHRAKHDADALQFHSPPSSGDSSPDENGQMNGSVGHHTPPPIQHSFRFSLEWVDRAYDGGKDRRVYPPQLPMPAQRLLHTRRRLSSEHGDGPDEPAEVDGKDEKDERDESDERDQSGEKDERDEKDAAGGSTDESTVEGGSTNEKSSASTRDPPEERETTGSKYTGRALAEWALVVGECHNFFMRRKSEGVTTDASVETPTLGMDAFRKF
ncbi:MAG: hypothetical protein M1838_002593 [Thelocarpon superellum]|nr:MAG: hypothetical protein M1838_002593 [Thelocarpon superellum]